MKAGFPAPLAQSRALVSPIISNPALTGGFAAVLRTLHFAQHLPMRAAPMKLLGLNLAISLAVRSGFGYPGFRFT